MRNRAILAAALMLGALTAAGALLATGLVTGARADAPEGPLPASALVLPAGPPFASAQDAIEARRKAYKLSGKIFKELKAAVEAGAPVKPYTADVEFLVAWSRKIPLMFPPGSDTGHETKALPEVWTDREHFERDAADYTAAAETLAKLAEADDKAGFARQFQATGKACAACHKAFRARLN